MLRKVLILIISLPKTVWVNFCFLPLRQAVRLPIIVAYNTTVGYGGTILIEGRIQLGMIRVGFHEVPACRWGGSKLEIYGSLIFKGDAHIGNGSNIFVKHGAELILGVDFKISSSTSLICYRSIVFGNNIQFSWECIVMDTDTHNIYDPKGEIMNNDRQILFGDNIWIGCKCIILKGSCVPDGCVIGAGTIVSGNSFDPNTIIAGNPASSRKKIGRWEL